MKRIILLTLVVLGSIWQAFTDDYDLLISDLGNIGLISPGSRTGSYNFDLDNNQFIDPVSEVFTKDQLLKLILESPEQVSEATQILLIKVMHTNYSINKQLPDIATFIKKLDLIGSTLAKKGIQVLAESAVYYLPDAAGNKVKATEIDFYADGTIKQVMVSGGRFFDFQLADGQLSQPRSISFSQSGTILELICDDRPIEVTTPDGQAVKAGIVSYYADQTVNCLAKFSDEMPIRIKLPNGQFIENPRTVVYSDQGKLLRIYSSPEAGIAWKFHKGDKIIRRYYSNDWREALEFFNLDRLVNIIGGIELSEFNELSKYWQDQIDGYF